MKRKSRKKGIRGLCMAGGWLAAFALWTAVICTVDVQPIGPEGTQVGLAGMNGAFHRLTGVHMALYTITDWLSIVPAVCVALFGLLGLAQWIRRGSLWQVDFSLLALGGYYAAVLAAYALFEICPVNYRPVLIDGRLEASYPSSTTMLVLCVMPTAAMQLKSRMRSVTLWRCALGAIGAFTAFMVLGRLLSGVHWLSDIVGGALLSAGLTALYGAICSRQTGR